jgi:hypothetical protein
VAVHNAAVQETHGDLLVSVRFYLGRTTLRGSPFPTAVRHHLLTHTPPASMGHQKVYRCRTPIRSFRSFRFFELPTYADTGSCSVSCSVERSCFLSDFIHTVPLGFERAQHRQTPRPSANRTRSKTLCPFGSQQGFRGSALQSFSANPLGALGFNFSQHGPTTRPSHRKDRRGSIYAFG